MRVIGTMLMLLVSDAVLADGWTHPAGFLDRTAVEEIAHKRETQEWAARQLASLDAGAQLWLELSTERLEALMPTKRAGVYWLMTCPECRGRLPFDPLNNVSVQCGRCDEDHLLTEQSIAAAPSAPYGGTLYDGWACSFILQSSGAAKRLALLHALGADRSYAERAAEILRLFAERTRGLPVEGSTSFPVIWTYAYEGDCSTLTPLVTAYELLRGVDGLFSPEEYRAIQQDLLKHWVDSVFRIEEDHSQRHNNTYRYLFTVALVGCAIEDADYVDWAYGQRAYSITARPEHRSLAWLGANNHLDDGAFWGLCSAYHLYALGPHCQAILLGSKLSRQMPDLFPPELYDEMDPSNPSGQTARRAIKWFTSQALPDLTMAPFGDMGGRVSLATYALTAEIGYRFLGAEEVGRYPSLTEGTRSMTGVLYGADTIEPKPFSHPSAFLSSGYVALRRVAGDNHLYAGLNALVPGSGHSHGDRLNLITYSRDRLLAGEKRTLYTDVEQRAYSGASYGHNTVTVDETSQEHGNYLTGDRIPSIATFVDLPALQVAEARGDGVYPQTATYGRLLCQFDEYLLDIFRVEGGETHDWFHHGIGEAPDASLVMESLDGFEPALYVMRGGSDYQTATTSDPFSVTWRIPAAEKADLPGRRRDVFSRVMMAAQPNQTVNVLSTYPDPAPHSLMVRHAGPSSLFVAVHEAYHESPIAVSIHELAVDGGRAYRIDHADGSMRIVIIGAGSGSGLSFDGQLATAHLGPDHRVVGLGMVRGRVFECKGLRLAADSEACLSVTFDAGEPQVVSSPPIAYHTVEGEPVYAERTDVTVELSVPAVLSPSGAALSVEALVVP